MKKRILAAVLAAMMVLGLCACGNGGSNTEAGNTENNQATETESEVVSESETESEDDGNVTYTVIITDEAGNPIEGALVQLCSTSCFPGSTNAEGVATFSRPEDTYKVSFLSLPEGYAYVDESVVEFYFAEGSTEITIALKVVE